MSIQNVKLGFEYDEVIEESTPLSDGRTLVLRKYYKDTEFEDPEQGCKWVLRKLVGAESEFTVSTLSLPYTPSLSSN